MSWYNIIIGVVIILVSISAVIIVLMQESRSAGLSGAIAGGADTFLGKNKGRSVEDKLVKITKYLTIAFFVLALLSTLIVLFF
ncbi:MAG: preprotein translocase subunit SecG [Clostridia bacterium]|nr:preprotein translocase subunit SecG [Clostridia bacterium]MBR0121459.1 preprotein translocase subunit SecG [Clostridia bacterium]